MPTMIPSRSRALLLSLLVTAAACGDSTAPPVTPPSPSFALPPVLDPTQAGRGELVESALLRTIPRAAIATQLVLLGASGVFNATNDVLMYRIRYRTPSVDGQLVTATAGVYLPANVRQGQPVIYLHGTTTVKTEVPSNPDSQEGATFGSAYAANGFFIVLPDYLGLGGGDGVHPWSHQQSQVSASVDALRAARALAATLGFTFFPNRLFITGYSQGGGAAMALHRELERNHVTEFPLLGSAPMAGAYDLSGTARSLLVDDPVNPASVRYTTFLTASFANVYRFNVPLSSLLVPPHDATGTAFINGTVTPAQLDALPASPRRVLQPAVVTTMLADSTYPLWRAVRDNDLLAWRPVAPMRLYYGGADRDVPPANSTTAQTRLRANGATNLAAVNVGAALDHGTAVVPSALAGKRFLDSLRAGGSVSAQVAATR